ncbi:hypothetical protein B0H14DRAFT_2939246, partial [Mycena olivaceomarginata]
MELFVDAICLDAATAPVRGGVTEAVGQRQGAVTLAEDEDADEQEHEEVQEPEEEEEPPRAVRAPVPAPPALRESEEETESAYEQDEEAAPPPPPPRRRAPAVNTAPAPADEPEQEEEQEEVEETEEAPPPPPRPASDHRRSIPPLPRSEETDSVYELEGAPAPPPRITKRSLPMMRVPPPPEPEPEEEQEQEQEEPQLQEEEEEEEEPVEVPPPLPAGRRVPGASPPDDYEELETPEIGAFEHVSAPAPVPVPAPTPPSRRAIPPAPEPEQESAKPVPPRPSAIVTGKTRASAIGSAGLLSPASAAFELKRQQEILDEDEGDPIDPAFYSPSRRTSAIDLNADAPAAAEQAEVEEAPAEPVEDPETVRRRTIAERMAKLGGIKFGGPPPVPRARVQQTSEDEQAAPAVEQDTEQPPEDEEEEERARKERIAAKLAGMVKGAGWGWSDVTAAATSARCAPARPPPPPQEIDSEHESFATNSEDGVRVEAEESEIEEIRHEDAEEVPPPVPTRSGHRTSISSIPAQAPPVPAGRPPVPSAMPQNRRASGQITAPTSRKASAEAPHVPSSNAVGLRPSINRRPRSSRPPPRTAPSPPSAVDHSESIDSLSSSQQWELPSIPTGSLDFGGGIDTTFS